MTNQVNIINDLSTLTRVPIKALDELTNKEALCIGSAIHDAQIKQEEAVLLNIGLGTLAVELSTMQCKFIPGKELKTAIKRSLTDKIDPVELELEQEIVDKLLNICNGAL